MNEKIKQFGEQAIHYAASRPMPELKDQDLYLDNLFEKFAELIVEECANLFSKTFTDEQYQRRIDKTIRKHFGIIE